MPAKMTQRKLKHRWVVVTEHRKVLGDTVYKLRSFPTKLDAIIARDAKEKSGPAFFTHAYVIDRHNLDNNLIPGLNA